MLTEEKQTEEIQIKEDKINDANVNKQSNATFFVLGDNDAFVNIDYIAYIQKYVPKLTSYQDVLDSALAMNLISNKQYHNYTTISGEQRSKIIKDLKITIKNNPRWCIYLKSHNDKYCIIDKEYLDRLLNHINTI